MIALLVASVRGEGSLPGAQTTPWSPDAATLGVRASGCGSGGGHQHCIHDLPTMCLKNLETVTRQFGHSVLR